MTEIEQEFLDLFLDDGALTLLAKAAEEVRSLLLHKGLHGNNIQRIGHCGIAAEYLSGVGMLHQDMSFCEHAPDEQAISEITSYLVQCFEIPSQLSNSSLEIAKEHHKNENCFDAIPRAIEDTQEWAETADLSLSEKANLAALLTECSEQYTRVRNFAKRIRDMSPS
jgi:hypothetical protein